MDLIVPYIDENIENKEFTMDAPVKTLLKTNKIPLIDADFIKYFVCAKIKKDLDSKDQMIFKNPAKHYTRFYLDLVINSFDAPTPIFCFSGSSDNTFRNAVAFEKKYKGNRVYTPLYEGELEDKTISIKYIKDRYPTLLYKDLEADDILSMLQDDDTFIYSRDKDLIQIPGTHFDIKTKQFIEMTPSTSFQFLMKQMITGDSVDNIVGMKGRGEVYSSKLLTNKQGLEALQVIMLDYCKTNGLFNGVDMFVESWNLLRLRNKRGTYFQSRYQGAFDVLKMVKLNR